MSKSQKSISALLRSLTIKDSSSMIRTPAAGPSSRPLTTSTKSAAAAQQKQTQPPTVSERGSIYPFSSRVLVQQTKPEPTKALAKVNNITRGVMPRVNSDLRTKYDPENRLSRFFDKGSKDRIPPGSVLVVESWTSPTKTGFSSFSGVLLGVRRRGVSTSFVLRNLVLKLGVEMRFNLYSPLLKDIRVIQRAEVGKGDKSGKLRRARRAKLYYLRKDDRRLAVIGNAIKQQRALEEREKERIRIRGGASRR
ncbi:hypothetical protein IE53DRAFT_412092 [Violaceomyces palustris]|uniref:Uncharacterized protein n=1 Tax=Violaceomyces palustris TaxID=1673888 RepID=A0ACD0NSN0_9BASI|nr:hypothetical protein IE53DRAFT_412092 [Violaceomyces palustris]